MAFSHGWVRVHAGAVQPLGSLSRTWSAAPRLGGSLLFAHWDGMRSRLDLSWHRFGGGAPLSVLSGAAGFDWTPWEALPLELGASLGLFRVKSRPGPVPRLNDDGETEFGAAARLGIPVWSRGDWRVLASLQGEQVWTLPHASGFLSASLGLERRLW